MLTIIVGMCLYCLTEILSNFVSNALKFISKGHVSIGVKSLGQKDNKIKLEFSVRDTGIGMAASQRKKIFMPFAQAMNIGIEKFIALKAAIEHYNFFEAAALIVSS